MDDTAASVPRCQERRIKSKSARFPSPLVTPCPVSRQPPMPRNAACRRVGMFLKTYAIALSLNVLSTRLHISLHNGALLAGASSVLPAKQGHAGNSGTEALSPFPTVQEPYRVPSKPEATASKAANTAGVEKQSLSEFRDGTETVEALPNGKQPLRLLASTSPAAPWSVLGTVLPSYLLMLERKLLAALKKLSPVRWEAVSSTAERVEPRFPAFGPNIGQSEEGGAFDSRVYPLNIVAGTQPVGQESVRLPGGVLDDPVQPAAQLWRGFFALAQANGYVGALPQPVKKKVKQVSSAPAQGHGRWNVVPSDRLPVDRVKKAVQQVINDITVLASVQQLVSDFARRLNYSLQAEQALRERIFCLAASDAQSDKSVERRPAGSQPGEDRCARVEKLQKEERLALQLAMEKLLNSVQRAARDATQLLFSILSSPEFDSPFERYSILPQYEQMSPLMAIALRLLERLQDLQYVAAPANPQAAELASEKEPSQTVSHHSSRSQVNMASSPGLAPRSLANASMLRGHTLFSKDLQPRPNYPQVPFTPSPRRASVPSSFYAPRQAYQCFKRPAEGQPSTDVLQCECRQPTEALQEAAILEPLICSRVRRATSHRTYLPAVEQTLECYPAAPDPSYIQSPQALPRAPVEYATVPTRAPLPAAEPPLQCHCYKPRAQYECRRPAQQILIQKEAVRVVPEVVEHRAVEPVVTPLECEIFPRHELYVPPPVPVPETVLVPCECIEQSVAHPGSYMPKQEAEAYSAGHHESVLIPVECIVRSPQPERVPCDCVARAVGPESMAYMRPSPEYTPYVECTCVRDEQQLPLSLYPVHAYPYEFAE